MIEPESDIQRAVQRAVCDELDRRAITSVELPRDERVRRIVHRVRRKVFLEIARPMIRERRYFKRKGHGPGFAWLTSEVRKLARQCGLGT
jgi:hypothetical protein